MLQTARRYCDKSSPRMSCSVKFLEPTVSAGSPETHPVEAAIAIVERNVRRSISTSVVDQQLLDAAEKQVGDEGHNRRGDSAGENHLVVNHGNAAEDEFAETAGANGSSYRSNTDGDDRRNTNSGEHYGKGQRQLD